MKRITITESQYKRLLLSEQVKNPSYYCIKKDYSTKGKEVKLPNGVSFKILNKNGDALYFVESGTFYHIKDGKGWKKSGKYDCGTNEYSVGKSKGKLYDYINNFLSQKSTSSGTKSSDTKGGSTESIQYCVAEGKRLNLIRRKFSSEDFEVKMGNEGCFITTKRETNKNNVLYKLSFFEDPNVYQLELWSKGGIKNPILENIFKGNKDVVGKLQKKPTNIVVNGSYSIEKRKIDEQEEKKDIVDKSKEKGTDIVKNLSKQLGAYYIQIVEIDGEKPSGARLGDTKFPDLKKLLNGIIESSEIVNIGNMSPEDKRKSIPDLYYAEELYKHITNNEGEKVYTILVDEIKNDCGLLEKIKERYESKYGNSLRNDWNKNITSFLSKFSQDDVNAMSDYLIGGGCNTTKFKEIEKRNKKLKK